SSGAGTAPGNSSRSAVRSPRGGRAAAFPHTRRCPAWGSGGLLLAARAQVAVDDLAGLGAIGPVGVRSGLGDLGQRPLGIGDRREDLVDLVEGDPVGVL